MRHRIRMVAMARMRRVRRQTGEPQRPHKKPRLRIVCVDCGMLVIDVQPREIALIRLLGETHHMLCPWSPIEIGIRND